MTEEDAAAVKRAQAEARSYYENVVGTPRGEDYDLFVEGYVEGYMSGRRGN